MTDRDKRRDKRHEKREYFDSKHGCPAKIHEEVDVTVPCIVRADVEVGEADIRCMGSCIVTRNSSVTPGRPGAVSRFTVCQKMCVDIPMTFHCNCEVGEGHVHFEHGSDNDIC